MDEMQAGGDGTTRGWSDAAADGLAAGPACALELELGGLIAALSASTEDELELDLRVRALVEGGRHRITIGDHAVAPAFGN